MNLAALDNLVRIGQLKAEMVSKGMTNAETLLPEVVAQRIYFVRGYKVMLDEDLATVHRP